jgi:hypothetical protein
MNLLDIHLCYRPLSLCFAHAYLKLRDILNTTKTDYPLDNYLLHLNIVGTYYHVFVVFI